MRLWLLTICTLLVLQETIHAVAFGVPPKVANRMVPTWWFTAKNVCYRGSDCRGGECCARPMLSANSYCMPLKRKSNACNVLPTMLYPDEEVYFGDCPCEADLKCLGFQTRSICMDLKNFEVDFHRFIHPKRD